MVSDSFVFPPLFTVVPDLLLPLLLRLEELTPVVVDFPDVRFVPAFCPDEGFEADLFVTVVFDRRVVPAFCPDDGFVTDLFVTVVFDRRVVPAFCPDEGFETGLLVTVVFDRRVVPAFCPDG